MYDLGRVQLPQRPAQRRPQGPYGRLGQRTTQLHGLVEGRPSTYSVANQGVCARTSASTTPAPYRSPTTRAGGGHLPCVPTPLP